MIKTSPNSHPRNTRVIRLSSALATLATLALVAAVPALAQDPTAAQYDNSVTQVTHEVGGGPTSGSGTGTGTGTTTATTPAASASGLQKSVVGGLPFTGLDLIALVGVAAAFTSVGFALRRMTAPKHTA